MKQNNKSEIEDCLRIIYKRQLRHLLIEIADKNILKAINLAYQKGLNSLQNKSRKECYYEGLLKAKDDFIKIIDERLNKLQGRIKYDEQEDLMRFARKDELEELKQKISKEIKDEK